MMHEWRRKFRWYLALMVFLLLALKGPAVGFLAQTAGLMLSTAGFFLSQLAGVF